MSGNPQIRRNPASWWSRIIVGANVLMLFLSVILLIFRGGDQGVWYGQGFYVRQPSEEQIVYSSAETMPVFTVSRQQLAVSGDTADSGWLSLVTINYQGLPLLQAKIETDPEVNGRVPVVLAQQAAGGEFTRLIEGDYNVADDYFATTWLEPSMQRFWKMDRGKVTLSLGQGLNLEVNAMVRMSLGESTNRMAGWWRLWRVLLYSAVAIVLGLELHQKAARRWFPRLLFPNPLTGEMQLRPFIGMVANIISIYLTFQSWQILRAFFA